MEIKKNNIYLGNAYELIKQVPSKSIDLIYTDVPYLYVSGGGGKSELGKRTAKKRITLMGCADKYVDSLIDDPGKRSEALRIAKNKATQGIGIVDMEAGFDFSILDEFCRVLKHIYIYGVASCRFTHL